MSGKRRMQGKSNTGRKWRRTGSRVIESLVRGAVDGKAVKRKIVKEPRENYFQGGLIRKNTFTVGSPVVAAVRKAQRLAKLAELEGSSSSSSGSVENA